VVADIQASLELDRHPFEPGRALAEGPPCPSVISERMEFGGLGGKVEVVRRDRRPGTLLMMKGQRSNSSNQRRRVIPGYLDEKDTLSDLTSQHRIYQMTELKADRKMNRRN
jgi:hypothetical protein